ncbi:MAG: hypothetical protein WAP74_03595 [Patescibacteria group bacterium]
MEMEEWDWEHTIFGRILLLFASIIGFTAWDIYWSLFSERR